MENFNKILYSVNGNIAILTINRPERRNALDAETLEQIIFYWTEQKVMKRSELY